MRAPRARCTVAVTWRVWPRRQVGGLADQVRYVAELQTKVPEDFTITEKIPTRAFSLLKKAANSISHLRHLI